MTTGTDAGPLVQVVDLVYEPLSTTDRAWGIPADFSAPFYHATTTPIAQGLAAGTHVVELYRRTEASQGEAQFLGFDFGSGKLLSPPAAKARRIELVGDSISCGYGDEGANQSCPFTADTENHYLSYGALAARAVDAELITVAWS